MAAAKSRKTVRIVLFEVKTSRPLPIGQQVFICGSDKRLGNWRADGLPLTRMGENAWSGHAQLPVAEAVEYKITRGSWGTEALDEKGQIPGNHVLKPGGDITVRHSVASWLDEQS